MKKFFVLICLFFALMSVQSVNAQMTSDDPVYIETISNPSKTINLILGLYPKTYKWSESLEASQITLRILNEATGDYDWSNYKVYILLSVASFLWGYFVFVYCFLRTGMFLSGGASNFLSFYFKIKCF